MCICTTGPWSLKITLSLLESDPGSLLVLEKQENNTKRLDPNIALYCPHILLKTSLVSELNLMVVGNSGVGKTSFLRTLFGTLQLRASALKSLHKPDSSNSTTTSSKGSITPDNRPTSPISPTSPTTGNGIGTKANGTKDSVGYATGPLERTLNSFEALFEIEESSEKINLTMVDTPGFVGTDEVVDSHCDEILAYLEYQFDLTLAEVKMETTRTSNFIV